MADPISHVNVLAVDGQLIVTWRGGGPEVSVFLSDSPDDAGTDVRAPDAPGRTTLRREAHPQYVHLFSPDDGFVVAAPRRIELDGPDNFRDIGGYPTADGSWTRWGRVFRSDGLHGLTDTDHGVLERLGITTVFDLRSDGEVEHAPDRLPAHVDHVHMPMSSDVAQQRSMLERIVDGDLTKFDEDDMAEGYLRMLEGFPDYIARMVTAVAEGETVLFHCTAGKDRTGITAMTMLGLAGVAEPYILDDYEISAQYRAQSSQGTTRFADQIREAGYDPDDFHAMWGSPRPAMRKTLDGLRTKWGDHAAYVRSIGVADDVAGRARVALRRED
ncbi:MAG: protein-tyrosine-phosphatase [Acidimicrobiales bacterium]|nr:MAG: protein-tyrosine-phosphatase [Acidimicrobiales bacterium]